MSTASEYAAANARPPSVWSATSPRPAGGDASEGFFTDLPGSDPDGHVDRLDPQLPVTDLPGASIVDDRVRHLLGLDVAGEDLHPDLGEEVDLVLAAAVHLGVSALATVATHLRERHARDLDLVERVGHRLDLVRLDDRDHQLHAFSLPVRGLSFPWTGGATVECTVRRTIKREGFSRASFVCRECELPQDAACGPTVADGFLTVSGGAI